MPSSRSHQTTNVMENNVLGHDKEAPVVHGWDRTMRAVMQTSAARFDVTHNSLLAVILKPGIMLERHKGAAIGRGEIEARKHRPGRMTSSADPRDLDRG